MALIGATVEEQIVNFLRSKGLNNFGIAGAMGNLYAESALNSRNLQNSCEKRLGMTDQQYTTAVDSGSYTNFVHDSAGYGLCQWTYWSRKQGLLDYAKSKKVSIGDLEMQLEFFYKELSQSYPAVLTVLKTATSVLQASNAMLLNYERPADQSAAVQSKRAGYGQNYYDKYIKENAMTEQELRAKIVSIAQSYIGCKESDGSHKKIIDLYNSHKPLARNYKVQYTDAWCATFASAVAIQAGLTDIIPTECGCTKHIELFQKLGSWQENDAYVPSPGDYIFYDWQDGTNYATTDNVGAADHVGIVEKVVGKTITVIEGNYSDSVKRRTIAVNGRYIRGYGVPKYASKATASGTASNNTIKVEPLSATGTVTASSLNVRSGPNASYSIVGGLSKGNSVTIVGSCNGWYKIKYGSVDNAWVSAQYVTITTKQEDDDMTELQVRNIVKDVIAETRKEAQDNDCGSWSKEDREWAIKCGLITGSGTINGQPNYMWADQLTREQAVALLHRFAKMMGMA